MKYDSATARRLAAICRAIYVGTKEELPKEIEGGRTEGIEAGAAEGRTSLAVIVDGPGDDLVVAFRGTLVRSFTDDVRLVALDWIENLRAALVPLDVGGKSPTRPLRVHQGFLEEYQAVCGELVTRLEGRTEGKNLYVTGHSQGAAVAAIAALMLGAAGHEVRAAYTFAAPRPGDAAFREAVESAVPVFRMEIGNDVVPHVPPAAAFARLDANPLTKRVADRVRDIAAHWRAGILENPLAYAFVHAIPGRLRPHAEACFRMLQTSAEEYESVGELWYADSTDDTVRAVPAEEEESLLLHRNAALPLHPKDLFGDHWIGYYERAVT